MDKKTYTPETRLSSAEADRQWRQRMGVPEGEEPVSMLDQPTTYPLPSSPLPLSSNAATARWTEKLGLAPGEKPVSMTDITSVSGKKGTAYIG